MGMRKRSEIGRITRGYGGTDRDFEDSRILVLVAVVHEGLESCYSIEPGSRCKQTQRARIEGLRTPL